jgi:hypothetical protein
MVNGQQYFSYLIILLMRMNENNYVGKIKEIISMAMGWTYI